MAHWLNLPALGGSLIGAVALGIHLGESAIDLIDPIHFQGPAIHPRDRGAAVYPNGVSHPRPPAFADLYGWQEGRAARLADCGDCEALAARDRHAYSAAVPYFGDEAEPPPASGDEGLPRVESFDEATDEWAVREAHVARYADFPVESEEQAVEDELHAVEYADEPQGEHGVGGPYLPDDEDAAIYDYGE